MHRWLGILLLVIGLVGGWWLGRPQSPAVVEEVSAEQAWRHFHAEAALAQVCRDDVGPHPAWVALAFALSTFTLLTLASPNPQLVWRVALGLPPVSRNKLHLRKAAVMASTS